MENIIQIILPDNSRYNIADQEARRDISDIQDEIEALKKNTNTILLYDWDEKTLLGTVNVQSDATADGIRAAIAEFTAALMPSGVDMTSWDDETAKAYTVYDTAHPLTSHDGYTFGKWIDYNSDAFTIYGTAVAANTRSLEQIPSPEAPSYQNIPSVYKLKAAYIANSSFDTLTTTSQRLYTISKVGVERLSTSADYRISLKISRRNSSNAAVYRTRKPVLGELYYIDNGEHQQAINIGIGDEQIIDLMISTAANAMFFYCLDGGNVENVLGSIMRSDQLELYSSTTGGELGYIAEGTVQYINNQLVKDSTTTLAATIFNDAELDVTSVYGTDTTASVGTRRKQAVTNMKAALAQKATDEGTDDVTLTHDEMQNAITYGDYTGESNG